MPAVVDQPGEIGHHQPENRTDQQPRPQVVERGLVEIPGADLDLRHAMTLPVSDDRDKVVSGAAH